MVIRLHSLSHPEYFDFRDLQGFPCRGADQTWYPDPWQRKAGCGPTSAATILAYLAQHHETLSGLAPENPRLASFFVSYMEEVWESVTPTSRGLHSLSLFSGGCLSFAQRRGVSLSFRELSIGGTRDDARPSPEQCRSFLFEALDSDCPIAFLNYSNGALSNLDSWHWVPLISAEEGENGGFFCTVLDEGKEKRIDFSLWLTTTYFGGGFVVLLPQIKLLQRKEAPYSDE